MVFSQSDFSHVRLAKAQQYKAEFLRTLFGTTAATVEDEPPLTGAVFECVSESDNIIGLGFGLKITEGKPLTDEEAVRVYVREKLSRSSIIESEAIPSFINGMPTDVGSVIK